MTVETATKEKIVFGVKVIHDYPPVWNNVCLTFNIIPKNVIFAYGDCIYNPDDIDLPEFLVKHEQVHFKQQGGTQEGAMLWWGKYLRDPEFRIEQEVEAYGVQLREMRKLTKNREEWTKMLWNLAKSCSGPLYNNAITHTEAMKRILQASK